MRSVDPVDLIDGSRTIDLATFNSMHNDFTDRDEYHFVVSQTITDHLMPKPT